MSATRFLSARGRRLRPSAIRELQPLLAVPGMLSLGGGMPAPQLFPYSSARFGIKTRGTAANSSGDECRIVDVPLAELAAAQQYGGSYGSAGVLELVRALLERAHGVKVPQGSLLLTTGSQDGIFKVLDCLADPGDSIIVENPSYSGALAAMHCVGLQPVGVASDHSGMDPDILTDLLDNWEDKMGSSCPRPRLIYVIPNGQNPSGSTLSQERRERLYGLACKHDLLVLEDDPYYFLKLPETRSQTTAVRAASAMDARSFLSMDSDNRVIRFDSFSKIISAGLRVGVISGPAELVEKFQLHQQASCMQVSGFSQLALATVLHSWGHSGFDEQVRAVQRHYATQRDAALDAAEKHLRAPGLADFFVPSAGMFLWIRIADACGITDTRALVKDKAVAAKVLMVPGASFDPRSYGPDSAEFPSKFVRASYSTSPPEVIHEALLRFGTLLRAERDASASSAR